MINRRLSLRSQPCAAQAFLADGPLVARMPNRAQPLDREHKSLTEVSGKPVDKLYEWANLALASADRSPAQRHCKRSWRRSGLAGSRRACASPFILGAPIRLLPSRSWVVQINAELSLCLNEKRGLGLLTPKLRVSKSADVNEICSAGPSVLLANMGGLTV